MEITQLPDRHLDVMRILFRNGSKVILQSKDGEYWLTKRKKIRRTQRRQRLTHHSVRYLPIRRLTHKDIQNVNNKITIQW